MLLYSARIRIDKIRHMNTTIVQVVPDAGHSANEPA
ncbi:hypothetical protein glysoja_005037 [Glycine soja]|nr:hypothetical protein glysoja_005037 [Glycine soja]